jgi:hypothetical protein
MGPFGNRRHGDSELRWAARHGEVMGRGPFADEDAGAGQEEAGESAARPGVRRSGAGEEN